MNHISHKPTALTLALVWVAVQPAWAQSDAKSLEEGLAENVKRAISIEAGNMYSLVRTMTAIRRGLYDPDDKELVEKVRQRLEKRKAEIRKIIAELRSGKRLPDLTILRLGSVLLGYVGQVPESPKLYTEIIEINGPRLMLVLISEQDYSTVKIGNSRHRLDPLETRTAAAYCFIKNLSTRNRKIGQEVDLSAVPLCFVEFKTTTTGRKAALLEAVSAKKLLKPIVKPLEAAADNADRAVAEWILMHPMTRSPMIDCVDTDGKRFTVNDFLNLPADGFTVQSISFPDNPGMIDDDFEAVGRLKGIRRISVRCTSASDEAFKHVAKAKSLESIAFLYSAVGDEALPHLEKLDNLITLDLRYSLVTDAGCAHLGRLKQLQTLNLSECTITNKGLKELDNLSSLRQLDVSGTDVTIDGLREFKSSHPLCNITFKR